MINKNSIEFLSSFFRLIKSINASDVVYNEFKVTDPYNYFMPQIRDVFGNQHKHFYPYQTVIPSFHVRSFKNAYCFTNREEIFSEDKRVIKEYTSQKSNPIIGQRKNIFCTYDKRKIDGRVAHLSLSGLENNYYHFLTECLGRLYLIEHSNFKPDYYILSKHLRFQNEWISVLGLDSSRIIGTDENQLIQASELIIPDLINNWEYVNFRGYQHFQKQWLPIWMKNFYDEIIKHKNNNQQETPEKLNERIYISRSLAPKRKILNESDVQSVFSDFGFGVYHLENMSVMAQINLFKNASVIAGLHGAGLVNMVCSPENTTIFELFTENYHDASFRIYAKTLGFNYHYMIGKTDVTKGVHPQQESVYIEIYKLSQALNRIFSDH